jgi:hypothetical protein
MFCNLAVLPFCLFNGANGANAAFTVQTVETVETVETVQTAHLWCKTVETVSRPEGPKAVSPGHRPGYKVSAANALQGQPMEQREQCEHAQTLPSSERLRVGEHSSGIRGRQSQKHFAE